jgi:hypoxanthine-guanine phosphoribosyltransferase
MDKQLLDIYSDYLISSFSYTTATGLSIASEGKISHDKVARFLNSEDFTSSRLWRLVKPVVRKIQSTEGVIIIDDIIEEKPSIDENEIGIKKIRYVRFKEYR